MNHACNRREFLKSTCPIVLSLAGLGLLGTGITRAGEPFKRTGKPRLQLSLAAYSFRDTFPIMRGKPTTKVERVGPQGTRRGTRTTFQADAEMFETTEYSFDTISQRLRESGPKARPAKADRGPGKSNFPSPPHWGCPGSKIRIFGNSDSQACP